MNLSNELVSAAAAQSFSNAADIIAFFTKQTGAHYIDWFNANCALKVSWSGKELGSTPSVKASFEQIWDNIPQIFGADTIDLLQFTALMSILTNEVGAQLQPVTELCGHQGLAYPFNAIPKIKRSYNSLPDNRLAGDLFFDDELFWSTHGPLAPGNTIRSREDLKTAWNGTVYPSDIPFGLTAEETAFIQQADFYKFRGRGFIQMTWRSNYKGLVKFVQEYAGDHPLLLQYKDNWGGKDPDSVCTASTNDDWDALFQDTNLIVPCRAIGLHNEECGHYLKLSVDAATLTAVPASPAAPDVPGSLYRMGHRISGGAAYATLFNNRVIQVLTTLNFQN